MSRLHDVFHVSMLRNPDFGLEDTSVTNERDPTSEGLVEKSQCGRGYMGTRGPNAGAIPLPLRVTGTLSSLSRRPPFSQPPRLHSHHHPLKPDHLPPPAISPAAGNAEKRVGFDRISKPSISFVRPPNRTCEVWFSSYFSRLSCWDLLKVQQARTSSDRRAS
ncbi:unnamed protein product [Prunus brigantina]